MGVCAHSGCSRAPTMRCLDCDGGGLYCDTCLIDRHLTLPFHRPEEWCGTHFEWRTLVNMGLVLWMNHGEGHYPHKGDNSGPQVLTVVDVNGVHEVKVGGCRCALAPSHCEQLLDRHLFPATQARPATAFTYRVMKLFHMLNHVG
ncbi:hypothetical protein K439DRAFT_1353064 [Ramaria rubella]|nr:hypothetical protein K439DRAFT_1353064 [Ramaria rubella]